MIRRPVPQQGNDKSYFEAFWQHESPDDPVRFLYEVGEDGSVLRQVEFFRDGRIVRDSLENYPEGMTKFGIGSLHGDSFWKSEWDDEPEPGAEGLWMAPSNIVVFESAWSIEQ